ncbi:translocation and assembly module TamA [Novosphingobium chloroacetimidivorans]|uniref:Translocation and assembly module TamA n=1 Tax=Novosphingobium chloroacetimidivorans TaxID=1428314 RepID=A0A7W7K5M9_9SPHN|nr:BamA/TamA family outer membrane protein [Novosphingobium chloroacetimidivorans]MBB4856707.1 translocation and assembly module TamA [Novosphingobium chloroacetimidivorans]
MALALALLSSPALAQESASSSTATQQAATPPASPAEDAIRAGTIPVPAPPPGAALPQVDPIIPDTEFNSAIPALDAGGDPVLDQPLESIESFERRLATQQSNAKPTEGQAPPAKDPALADGDAVEEVGDAPVADAELTAPLPPLNQFEVAPVQFAEDEEAANRDLRVTYAVRLNGLDAADGETAVSLKSQFKSLSALEKGDGKADNVAMASARLTEDSELIKTILASEGWYDPQVRTHLDRTDGPSGLPLNAVIDVQPGKRFTFSEIKVDADPTVPPTLISDNLALKIGEPIVAERVQGAEAQVALALPENGYPFAAVGDRDILLDQNTGSGAYTLPVTVGPRGRFGGFRTEGDLAFDVDHVQTLARFKRGELYDSRKVDDLRKALVATGLFSTVSAEPQRTNEQVGDGTEYVTMLVKQDAGPPRTIAGSAGYAAGQGFTIEGTWTHRNMFPPEGALIVHGIAGTQEQGAGVTFRRANAGQRDRTFEAVAEGLRSDYDAYNAITGRLAARVSYDSTQIWQKRLTYAYGVELLGTAERAYDFNAGERRRRTYYVASLNGQVGLDTSDDLLNPTKGFRVTALVQPEGSLGNGFNPYIRARIDGSAYVPFGDFVLAGRVRFGTIQGAARDDIAPSRRLYSGGGGSVRGFGYQKLGPLDPNGDPIGGRSLNEGAIEGRYRFGNYGVVAFLDAGQSYESTTPKFSDMRYGVGIGGRFYTNFGPLRVDVATPLGRRRGESRLNIYVSIGQAF